MSDYVVRLTGEDNLSGTINSVKKELSDVGKVGQSAFEKIETKFQRIEKSAAPLKRQLRDVQALMAQMNADGLADSDLYNRMAQRAGEMKDAIADAADATRRFSSDTMKLDAAIQAFQGVAAVGTIATGTMALFGSENEKVALMIQKVQGALAILNGVQSVANILNKDSALMLRVKQIRIAANTKATVSNTVALGANTVATATNSLATKTSTITQNAWNVAKAVAKALVGDFTGLLLVGAGALTTYALATSDSSDKQEELNNEAKKGAEIQDTYTRTLSDTYAQLMTKYTQLKAEWQSLSSVQEKNDWIQKNKSSLDELNISVNNVADAEKAFNGNTDAVVQSFVKRAQAAARLAQLTELYRKQIDLIDKRDKTAKDIQLDARLHGRSANEGDIITDTSFRSSRYGSVGSDGNWRFTKQGAELYSGSNTNNNTAIKKIDSEIDENNKKINTVINEIKKNTSVTLGSSKSVKSTKNNITTTPKKSPEQLEFEKLEKERLDFLSKLRASWNINGVDDLHTKAKQGLNGNTQIANGFDTSKFGEMKPIVIPTKLEIYGNAEQQIQEIVNRYDIGELTAEAAQDAIDRINSMLESMGLKPIEIDVEVEKAKERLNTLGDSINDIASIASSFGNIFKDKTFNAASIIAQAVATYIMGWSEATAKAAKLVGPIGWAAFGLSSFAQMMGVVSQIKSVGKFAEGGIVGGSSLHGDRLLASVNSREMILNGSQQAKLFDIINNGADGNSPQVATVRIKGSDLYLALRNYSKTNIKTGKLTGIQ